MINFEKNYVNFLSYFFILIPIFLVTGPFLSDLGVSILAISSIFLLREKKYFFNFFTIIFIVFYILILISSIFSEHKILALTNSLFYFRFCLFSLFVWFLFERQILILKKIFYVLTFIFSLIIFDSIYQYFNGFNILNMEIIEEGRISSFFGDELKMGSFLMRLFPLFIAISLFYYDEKKHKKFLPLFFIFIIFIYLTVYLSGERTSFILFNFIILLLMIFIKNFTSFKLCFLFIFLLTSFFLLSLNTPFKERLINQTIEQSFLSEGPDKKKYIFSKQYNEHYISAWRMFNDNKFLGIGPKNFREVCKKHDYNISDLTCSTHPHNTMLQILSETGIFTFLIYILANFTIWFLLIKSKFPKNKMHISNMQISLLICISISIFPFSPSGSFFNNWVSTIYYLPVGLLLWTFRKHNKISINSFILKKFIWKKYFTK